MPRNRNHKKSGNKGKKHVQQSNLQSAQVINSEDRSYNDIYEIRISEVMGRYLVASKDLEKGEIIFKEEPLVVGPCQDSVPLCLGCYISIPDVKASTRCAKCKWPICSSDCAGVHKTTGHSVEECDLLAKCPAPETSDLLSDRFYNPIVPLRCLLLKKHCPDKWKELTTMESHNEIRKKIPSIWKTNQLSVVDRITKLWGCTEFSEEEIHTICGYLEVNAFEIGQSNICIRALYPNVYLVAHNCIPNTSHMDTPAPDFNLMVRASVEIKKGDLITLSYAHTLQGTLKRREHLKSAKFFDCDCNRCSDPTELQTFFCALKCPKCENGWVLPNQPLQATSDWECKARNCSSYVLTAHNVSTLMDRIQNDLDSIGLDSIEGLEMFLKQYEKVLHPNHYHMISAKHSLSQLYGKTEGFLIQDLTIPLLERKRNICYDLLKVFDVIEPGYSRLRGVLFYELHAPIMILTTRKFESRSISKKDLKSEIIKVANYLKESRNILSFEAEDSMEGIMGSAATNALVRLKDWEQIVGKIF